MDALGVWYIVPLTFFLAYFAAHTEYKWASMLCQVLVFFVPPFVLSAQSVNAIVITQLSDSLSLGIIALNLSKSRSGAVNLNEVAHTLALALPFAVAAATLVFVLTCEMSVIVIVPTALLFGATRTRRSMKEGAKEVGSNREGLIRAVYSFVSSATAFNQPLLVALAKGIRARGDARLHAFLSLFILTLVSGILNFSFTLLRFGNSFPYAALVLALGGTITGRLAAKAVPLKTNPAVFERIYSVLILFLASLGTILVVVRFAG